MTNQIHRAYPRTLAAEVTTIRAINAKIDAMRLKQDLSQRAVSEARAKVAKRIGQADG